MKKYSIDLAKRLQRAAAAANSDINLAVIAETANGGYYSYNGESLLTYITADNSALHTAPASFSSYVSYLRGRIAAGVINNIYVTC